MLRLFCFCRTRRSSCWLFPRCSGDGEIQRPVRTGNPAHLDAHTGRAQPESPDLIQYLDLNYVSYSKPYAAFLVKPAIPKAFLPGSRCL